MPADFICRVTGQTDKPSSPGAHFVIQEIPHSPDFPSNLFSRILSEIHPFLELVKGLRGEKEEVLLLVTGINDNFGSN
jgi:hypothetical protein